MATKVGFAYGNTTPTTSNSKFTDGTLYFNTSNQKIYFRQGSNVRIFDGNNNSGRCNIGLKTGGSSYVDPVAVYIQNAPAVSYSSSYTSSISGYSSWYNLFGQGVISSSTLVNNGYGNAMDIDEVISDEGITICGSLANVKEIVLAVDLINLGKAINNGTAVSGSINFGYTPADVIVHCYRTSNSSYAACSTDDYQGTPGGEMFSGKVLLGLGSNSSSSQGASAQLCTLEFKLCPNASNAVHVNGRIFTIETEYNNTSKNKNVSFYGDSAQYMYDEYGETFYPNIEKHIYPLYIRYI